MASVDLNSPFSTADQILAWEDDGREELEFYATQLTNAIARLKGRDDHAANWAREKLAPVLKSVREALENVPSIEAEREAYRASLKDCRACASAVAAAATAEALLLATAEKTLADRRAGQACMAFKAAAMRSRLPSPGLFPLHCGIGVAHREGDNDRIRETAHLLDEYDTRFSNAAIDAIHNARLADPESMPWQVANEGTDLDPNVELAFRMRWQSYARKHHLPHEEISLTSLAIDAAE